MCEFCSDLCSLNMIDVLFLIIVVCSASLWSTSVFLEIYFSWINLFNFFHFIILLLYLNNVSIQHYISFRCTVKWFNLHEPYYVFNALKIVIFCFCADYHNIIKCIFLNISTYFHPCPTEYLQIFMGENPIRHFYTHLDIDIHSTHLHIC